MLAEIFSVDLAISLSFLRVANHVELLPEVRMEGRQNFLKKIFETFKLRHVTKIGIAVRLQESRY